MILEAIPPYPSNTRSTLSSSYLVFPKCYNSFNFVNTLAPAIIATRHLLAAVGAAPRGGAPPPIFRPSTTTTTAAPTVSSISVEQYLQARSLNGNPDNVVNNYASSYHSDSPLSLFVVSSNPFIPYRIYRSLKWGSTIQQVAGILYATVVYSAHLP